ncbi:Crp/Fnr family transcriptional regulator [Azonexus caeni]|uniref:Crp/Fnr family transcriptional regulator n=1 Tax=Azonexus caeni TaxID=266126 RepID=UPI003A8A32D9
MMTCIPRPDFDDHAACDPVLLEVAQILAGTPLFSGLRPDDLLRLAAGCRREHYDKGNILFHKGDPCHGFYLALEGQIKLAFISQDGNQKVVEIIRPGQTFGEAVMFMERPYMLMAQALTDCRLLHIAKDAVFAELARDPQMCRKLIAGLSMRLHHLIGDLEAHSLRSGRERIIGYLLREEEMAGPVATAGAVTIRLPTHKGTIASRLNLTQEHFSRILHELVDEGLVVVQGRLIHVPDIGRLRAGLV